MSTRRQFLGGLARTLMATAAMSYAPALLREPRPRSAQPEPGTLCVSVTGDFSGAPQGSVHLRTDDLAHPMIRRHLEAGGHLLLETRVTFRSSSCRPFDTLSIGPIGEPRPPEGGRWAAGNLPTQGPGSYFWRHMLGLGLGR